MQLFRSRAVSAALAGVLVLSIATLVVFPSDQAAERASAPVTEEEQPARTSMSADAQMIHWVESAAQQAASALQRFAQVFLKAYQLDERAPSSDATISHERDARLTVMRILTLHPAFPQGP